MRAPPTRVPTELAGLTQLLTGRGFLAAEEEAAELLAGAAGDRRRLEEIVARRLTGEPLAWITGAVSFCGVQVGVDRGVYVPRYQTEQLARRAVARLPRKGTAIDLCTGSGAIAKLMMVERPQARVVACDLDERAVACAGGNGAEVYRGDLFAALPSELEGRVDVVVAVVPYVPTDELGLLQRDTFKFEPTLSYDGGQEGTVVLRRAMTEARPFLRDGGALLLELGGEQADLIHDELVRLGYGEVAVLRDDDGDARGIEATFEGSFGYRSE